MQNKFDFNKFDLQDYVNRFPEELREPIIGAIFEEKLLKEAFAENTGQNILRSTIDSVHKGVYDILIACRDMKQGYENEILRSASKINAVYDILYTWSRIFADGKKHREAIQGKAQ